jgi:(S)-2-hydroxyglutarate dehydrogenase
MAQAGNQSLRAFCYEYGVPFEVCGKLIVATRPEEIPQLDVLFDRALKNGVPAMRLHPQEVKEVEPHVSCIAAIRVPTTGIVDYRQVCHALVHEIQQQGGELKVGTEVLQVVPTPLGHLLETSWGSLETRFLINCAGLHSDRVARLGGLEPKAMIVPFRGEYFELKPERRYLVRNLIYPVPNAAFPFLGVHFTRAMDGGVHAGPNAVLSMKREGYRKSDFSWRDLSEVMTYPGFWRLSSRYYREGFQEMYRSWSKAAFTRSLQRLVPEVQADDLIPSQSGVRAQALLRDGTMVDDFLLLEGKNSLHVCNAPSPAATASLEIAKKIASKVPRPGRLSLVKMA